MGSQGLSIMVEKRAEGQKVVVRDPHERRILHSQQLTLQAKEKELLCHAYTQLYCRLQ